MDETSRLPGADGPLVRRMRFMNIREREVCVRSELFGHDEITVHRGHDVPCWRSGKGACNNYKRATWFLKLKNALRVFAVDSDRHNRHIGNVRSNDQVSLPRSVVLDVQADPVLVRCAAIGMQCTIAHSEFSKHLSLHLTGNFDPVRMTRSLGLSELHLDALAEAQFIFSLEHSDHDRVWWEAVLLSFTVIVIALSLCLQVPSSLDPLNFGLKVSNSCGALALASAVVVHISADLWNGGPTV